MGTLFIIFCGCIAFTLMGLYFWDKREGEAYDSILTKVKEIRSDYKKYDERQTELETTVKNYSDLVKELDAKIEACEARIAHFKDETDVFRDQVSDTREKQIKLREDLSKKTPKIELKVPQGPFLVELYSRPGTGRPTPNKGQGVNAMMGGQQANTAPQPAPTPTQTQNAAIPTYKPPEQTPPKLAKQRIIEVEKAAADKRKREKK